MLSSYKIFRAAVNKITYLVLHVKCPKLSSDIKEIRNFPTVFLESPLPNLKEIRQTGASLIYEDSGMGKQTDMTKIRGAVSVYA